ncbi:unnamed protein product [Cuscuta europaea]|uniref:Uncharacterized protein n=1 Tax=Cuscuta europaea TaxID=41803 RepID=A0A9P0YTW3_CUSEU|nr:unnamed protein product [Cuscuta europaea]
MVRYAHKSTIIFCYAADWFSSKAIISNSKKDNIVEETNVRYSCIEDESLARLEIIRTFILETLLDFIKLIKSNFWKARITSKIFKIPQPPTSKIKLPRRPHRGDCEDFFKKPSQEKGS